MRKPAPIFKAVLWMLASVTSLTLMAVSGRATTSVLSTLQVMELRSVLGFVMLLPLVMAAGGFRAMKTQHLGRHVARNTIHYGGQACWLFALTLIPLAQVIAIEFTMPIWTAILAVVLLGERMDRGRIVAIVLGIVGVTVIVRPGVMPMEAGHLFVLTAAVAFGFSIVLTKALTRTDSSVMIMFYMLLIQSAIGLVPAIVVWRNPPLDLWPWIVAIAFAGTFSHYCMARALSLADATVIMPVDFLRAPLAALVGWLLYSEVIDTYTAIGATLILAGNLSNLRRQSPAQAPQSL